MDIYDGLLEFTGYPRDMVGHVLSIHGVYLPLNLPLHDSRRPELPKADFCFSKCSPGTGSLQCSLHEIAVEHSRLGASTNQQTSCP